MKGNTMRLFNHLLLAQFAAIICASFYTPTIAAGNIASSTAIIVKDANKTSNQLASQLKAKLTDAGYNASIEEIDILTDKSKSYDLIVLCDASMLPLDSIDLFHKHFHEGGDLVAFKSPMWQKQLIQIDGKWIDRNEYLEQQAFNSLGNTLFDFSKTGIEDWQRDSTKPDIKYLWTNEKELQSGRNALKATYSDLQGSETMVSPELTNPFEDGSALTVFSAKGSDTTTQLAVRWNEKDGSRWLSVVPLNQTWRQYLLRPEDFKFNGGNPSREKSTFNPADAVRISFELSWGDTELREGSKEYWLGKISTAADLPEYKHLYGGHIELPDFDTLSPGYKLFHMSDAAKLKTHPNQSLLKSGNLPLPTKLMSPHQRPQGSGFDKERGYRWIPLLEGRTSSGEWRGTPATMIVNTSDWTFGSLMVSFGIQDINWYLNPDVINYMDDLFKEMHNGLFIVDGGADAYTYKEGQPINIGINTVNVSKSNKNGLTARVEVKDASTGKSVYSKSWPFILKKASMQTFSEQWTPKSWTSKGFIVSAEILDGAALVDKVQHTINIWKPAAKKDYVSIENGEFMLKNKPWRINGVNYHPSSTVATFNWSMFLEWFGKGSYDPDVIERDLRNMKNMGINSVSIQVFYSETPLTDNLLDFFRRLDKYGIKANLALPLSPMTDLDARWNVFKDVIEQYNLKDIDTIVSYDIDWEPTWLTTDFRKQWDDEWADWIVERYGSIENAEVDWGVPVPKDENGKITNPSVQQTQTDGEWRKLSSAYRRFLNTILYRQYSAARRLIRELDPNHPVSFRMHAAGDGGSGWYGLLPYDWSYLAAAVDFFGPEAYSLGKTWDAYIKRGLFTSAYGNWADKTKPIVYAEAGFSLYEYPGETVPRPGALENQTVFYKDFYKMLNEGSINGVYWWWYPGGFRCAENSDYGIINPDGSYRPVTKIVKEAPKLLNKKSPLKSGKQFTVDSEAYISSSEAGNIYDQIKDEFWEEINQGRMPTITSPGRGADSANCPLTAVGNSPYNGNNPPKYLDAWIDTVEILDSDGKWQSIKNGDELTVSFKDDVYMKVGITNLGEAKWLAGRETGSVSLIVSGGINAQIDLPIDVPHLSSITAGPYVILTAGKRENTPIKLRMEAKDRAPFGNIFTFTLK